MESYYDKLCYERLSPSGKNSWLGNLRWFAQETTVADEYIFSTIPSVKEDGQLESGVCGTYDMKRILFGIKFLDANASKYRYGADYIGTDKYRVSIPFFSYGAIFTCDGDISISTSDKCGRITGKKPLILTEIDGGKLTIHDENYFIVFSHTGTITKTANSFTIKKTDDFLHISVSFHINRDIAVKESGQLLSDMDKILADSKAHWENYLASCPTYKLDSDYKYKNTFIDEDVCVKSDDFEIRQLWHYWCVLMDISEIEFNRFPLYMAPDKPLWKGTWSNDGPECLCVLSLTNQAELAGRCIVDLVKAIINKDGILSWYIHSDGTGCYGTKGDSGLLSHGVPAIVHTVDFYIRNTGDRNILDRDAGNAMTVYEKLKLYITRLHELRDINGDHLIEWVNLWETGWDDKICSFFSAAGLQEWIDVVLTSDTQKIESFYNEKSRPVAAIVEQVYTLWALRSMQNLAKIKNDDVLFKYCCEKYTDMLNAVREKCWSEKQGFYFDFDITENALCKSKNADTFYFMYFEKDPKRLGAIYRHLENPKEFNAYYMPMSSLDNEGFNENGYWNGGHWPREMSYVGFALNKSGYKDKALEILIRAVMCTEGNVIAEVLNPLTGIQITNSSRIAYTALNVAALLELDGKITWSLDDNC